MVDGIWQHSMLRSFIRVSYKERSSYEKVSRFDFVVVVVNQKKCVLCAYPASLFNFRYAGMSLIIIRSVNGRSN